MARAAAGFEPATDARLVLLTGLSGSGKGTVLRALEDIGFYTVDNLPVDLMRHFVDARLASQNSGRSALVVDIREGSALGRFPTTFLEIRQALPTVLMYLEASDEAIKRRFSETRRPHPAGGSSLAESIAAERVLLDPIRRLASIEVDTSRFNVHDLRRKVLGIFQGPSERVEPRLTVGSFGFKYGAPTDGDLILDVRFLPNPHYEPECRSLTGQDRPVIDFLEAYSETADFLERAMDLLEFVVPRYTEEGKSYLSIYFGCTGGRHRSVYVADRVAARLGTASRAVRVQHRDIDKDH